MMGSGDIQTRTNGEDSNENALQIALKKYILHCYFAAFPSKKFNSPAPSIFKKSSFFSARF